MGGQETDHMQYTQAIKLTHVMSKKESAERGYLSVNTPFNLNLHKEGRNNETWHKKKYY